MRICKTFNWCYGHSLSLPYYSKCQNYHGHNAKVEVEVEGPINKNGMVLDFGQLKEITEQFSFDHKHLNDIVCPHCKAIVTEGLMNQNPTAENMVMVLKKLLDEADLPPKIKIRRIRIYETDTSYAEEVW